MHSIILVTQSQSMGVAHTSLSFNPDHQKESEQAEST